jgi:hypothetical protein
VLSNATPHPFPDYVPCPHCGELEVEVWCYDGAARCHACGQTFQHLLPQVCEGHCDRAMCEIGHPHNQNTFS